MRAKKHSFLIILFLILLCFSSCYEPTTDISFDNISKSSKDSSGIETINIIDYDDDDLNINWGYGCKLDGVVYTVCDDSVRYYENGELKYICRDPLCKHTDLTCASSKVYSIRLIATDGEKLYCSGSHFEKNPEYQKDIEAGRIPDKDEFVMNDGIYEINIQTQKLKVITQWEMTGSFIPLLRINGEYIYFLIVTSESKSDLYRVKKSGGEAELVSKNNDERISNVIFGDNMVLYRKNNKYYKTDLDFENSEFFLEEILSFITFKDDYIYYSTGDKKLYECKNSDKKVSLFYTDIYRIKQDNLDDFTKAELLLKDVSLPDRFIITDNKIVYFPNEPVYIGKRNQGENIIDLYNCSNGKIMTLDLNTLEKKTVCTEIIDGTSHMNYADDNQVFIYNFFKQKPYRIDLNSGELAELEVEK